jgi:hypothetical protein
VVCIKNNLDDTQIHSIALWLLNKKESNNLLMISDKKFDCILGIQTGFFNTRFYSSFFAAGTEDLTFEVNSFNFSLIGFKASSILACN